MMLREWFEPEEHEGAALSHFLIEQILDTGLEPVEPPPLLPPITPEGIELLCWMGIEPAAVDVVALDDHVAQVDPDAQHDPPVPGHRGVALGHPPLDRDRAGDRLDHAGELARPVRRMTLAAVWMPHVLPDHVDADHRPALRRWRSIS